MGVACRGRRYYSDAEKARLAELSWWKEVRDTSIGAGAGEMFLANASFGLLYPEREPGRRKVNVFHLPPMLLQKGRQYHKLQVQRRNPDALLPKGLSARCGGPSGLRVRCARRRTRYWSSRLSLSQRAVSQGRAGYPSKTTAPSRRIRRSEGVDRKYLPKEWTRTSEHGSARRRDPWENPWAGGMVIPDGMTMLTDLWPCHDAGLTASFASP